MTHSEILKATLELLITKALLSQKSTIKLLLRDLSGKGLDISDTVTVLARLQGEKALKVESVTQAPNTKINNALSVFDSLLQVHGNFDLNEIDKNLLTVNDVLDIRLYPTLLPVLEQVGLSKSEIGEVQLLFKDFPHPAEVEIYCPNERSILCKTKTESDWMEICVGKVFHCKDRHHPIKVTFRGEAISMEIQTNDLQKISKQIDADAGGAVSSV